MIRDKYQWIEKFWLLNFEVIQLRHFDSAYLLNFFDI